MDLNFLSNTEIITEILKRFPNGLFGGIGLYSLDPHIAWSADGGPYTTRYLFRFARSSLYQVLAKRSIEPLPEVEPSLDIGEDDLELSSTSTLVNQLNMRFTSYFLSYIKPSQNNKKVQKMLHYQGCLIPLMGLVSYAEQDFETKSANSLELDFDDSLSSFRDSDLGAALWVKGDQIYSRAQGEAFEVIGFVDYISTSLYKKSQESVEKHFDPDDPSFNS